MTTATGSKRHVIRKAYNVATSEAGQGLGENRHKGMKSQGERCEEFIADWMAAAPGFSVLVELRAEDNGSVTIEKLQTWPTDRQGRGEATRALETLCKLADIHGVMLCGRAQPYSKRAEDAIRLRLWLARYGFAPTGDDEQNLQLYRPPRQEPLQPAVSA